MIPEAGNRAELKAAMMHVCSRDPLPGEMYEIPKWQWVGPERRVSVASESNNTLFFRPQHGTWGQCIYRRRWNEMVANGGVKFIGYAD